MNGKLLLSTHPNHRDVVTTLHTCFRELVVENRILLQTIHALNNFQKFVFVCTTIVLNVKTDPFQKLNKSSNYYNDESKKKIKCFCLITL